MIRACTLTLLLVATACTSPPRRGGGDVDGFLGNDDLANALPDLTGQNQQGCAGQANDCFAVYAHSDHILYYIDLSTKALIKIGTMSTAAGGMDNITDLAVAPDGTLYVISATDLYRADTTTAALTLVGPVSVCGMDNIALSFTPDGSLYVGDHLTGAFCKIDLGVNPPAVTQIGLLGGGLALSGDIVTIADGTMYGTAYKIADTGTSGTQSNNLLIKINPATGASIQTVGSTTYPKLFGAAYALGEVFGFTHDGTGNVVTINPTTGKGTLFNTFTDPGTGKGISFGGAGVNSLVPAIP